MGVDRPGTLALQPLAKDLRKKTVLLNRSQSVCPEPVLVKMVLFPSL
jgi:hypothetical protein